MKTQLFPQPTALIAMFAGAVFPLLIPDVHAGDLLVSSITNFQTSTVGASHYYKYDYNTVYLLPDGSTEPFDSGSGYTYAITVGSSDPDAAFADAYTAVLASAKGGYIIETASSATRPTPMSGAGVGGGSLFGWDSTFAQDFNYTALGEGAHNISSSAPSFKIWLITASSHPVIALSHTMNFGQKPVGTKTKRAFTISNVGTSPLVVTGISFPAGFAGAWSGTIESNSIQSVNVTFHPTALKSYTGKIVVRSNAYSGGNKLRVSGSGN